ncbi:Acetyltransferase (GNAT) family protein [Babesia bovis T2Bo]|uniref:N-alpha-acetyltransferase 40 n=1 Tax=Babesia bovis TaxID=5865 RepID=A7AME0_BABBO|nr:Acetyltransferase (GNAT) family protein [Babesia bovis T2Bo]EDO07724.1 Acetyltransferase (GNAT) family protein [Babesia bovis T2Bo]|eukprot:XP_001611292.1 acetyltransferase, GNAT family protein [Babesia bovis T2Bo]
MPRKRHCNALRKVWYPETIAKCTAEAVCAVFNQDATDSVESDKYVFLQNKLDPKYRLKHYMGNEAPKEVMEAIFSLTKDNMSQLYDAVGFLGGWRDNTKLRELSAAKTHILELTDDNGKLVGFVSYRFLLISDCQPTTEVCYIYELQVNASRRSSGVGRYLMKAAEVIAKEAGAKKLMCTVLKTNNRAVAFYRNKCGFTDDESDPSSIDFEHRHDYIYYILKLDIAPLVTIQT